MEQRRPFGVILDALGVRPRAREGDLGAARRAQGIGRGPISENATTVRLP